MKWEEIYDNTEVDVEGKALYESYCAGAFVFYLSNSDHNTDGIWDVGISDSDGHRVVIKDFDCPTLEMAKVWGKKYIKEYLEDLIKKID